MKEIITLILSLLLVIASISLSGCIEIKDMYIEEKGEVFYTNAPFGIYWFLTKSHSSDSGGMLLFFPIGIGGIDSQGDISITLEETYLVKYLDDNNQLHTRKFSAYSERNFKVYLTENISEMYIIYKETSEIVNGRKNIINSEYNLYIPDPRLFEEIYTVYPFNKTIYINTPNMI